MEEIVKYIYSNWAEAGGIYILLDIFSSQAFLNNTELKYLKKKLRSDKYLLLLLRLKLKKQQNFSFNCNNNNKYLSLLSFFNLI